MCTVAETRNHEAIFLIAGEYLTDSEMRSGMYATQGEQWFSEQECVYNPKEDEYDYDNEWF